MKLSDEQAAALREIALKLPKQQKPRGGRPKAFRQHDVTRALRAVQATGLNVTGVEIDPATGKIVVRTGSAETVQGNDLDKWLSEQHAH